MKAPDNNHPSTTSGLPVVAFPPPRPVFRETGKTVLGILHRLVTAAVLLTVAGLLCANSATASLTVTPGTIANDYTGPLDLNITGLDSAGQTVVIEEYIDADNSGTINAGDILIRKIQVTDGQTTSIAGQRNLNIPGDEDGVANGLIHTRLLISGRDPLDKVDGHYIIRVSPSGPGFTPFTASLTVTQKDYSGSGISGSTGQAGAVVLLQIAGPDNGTFAITRADALGNYSLKLPAGTYQPIATKTGFVFNAGTGPVVTVTSGSFANNKNLTLVASTRTISGAIRDATTHTGLPAVAMEGMSQGGFVSVAFADSSGNYTLDANTGTWKIQFAEQFIAELGYVNFKTSDNSAGNVTGFNVDLPRVTSLIYGTLKTPANIPLPYFDISANTNGTPAYKTSGVSDANGNYTLGATIGDWQIQFQPTGYVTLGQNVVVNTNGSAVSQNITANPITAHLRGQIRDSHNNAVGNVSILAYDPAITNGSNYLNSFATSDVNGNFDIGVFGGGGTTTKQWGLQLNIGNNGTPNFISTQASFNVQDGVDINGITYLVYAVTTHLIGQVLDENNAIIGNIAIWASLNPNGFASSGSNVDGSGSFNIPVFGGNWNLGLSNITGLGLIPQDSSVTVADNVDQNNLVFRARHANQTITGSVKGNGNVAIAGINVQATTTLGGTSYSSFTTTDSGGNYSLPVFSSTWSVNVDGGALASQGYQPVSNQNVFVSANVTGINFVPVSVIRIASSRKLTNGHFFMQCTGAPNTGYHIQAATVPSSASFVNVAAVTADGNGAFSYEDLNTGSFTRRFYRVSSP